MKKKHFYCCRDWFVFPISIEWQHNLYQYIEPTGSLCIHFLWWHWRWVIKRKRW